MYIYSANSTDQSSSDEMHPKTNNWLTSNLSFLLWNARSLNNQMHNFQSYIYSNDTDIIAITETWLTKHIYTNELLPCGYNVLRKDRDGRGGGVLLALKDSISFRELSTPNDLETLSAEVTFNNLTFVICLIYRPPNYQEQYDTMLLSYVSALLSSDTI